MACSSTGQSHGLPDDFESPVVDVVTPVADAAAPIVLWALIADEIEQGKVPQLRHVVEVLRRAQPVALPPSVQKFLADYLDQLSSARTRRRSKARKSARPRSRSKADKSIKAHQLVNRYAELAVKYRAELAEKYRADGAPHYGERKWVLDQLKREYGVDMERQYQTAKALVVPSQKRK
jgi:hypothetical protein